MNKMIPSELIHADENGNVVIDGATKFSGGIEPIHTYQLPDNYSFLVLIEKYDNVNDLYVGVGVIESDDGSLNICLFSYTLNDGKISRLDAVDSKGIITSVIDDVFEPDNNFIDLNYSKNNLQGKIYTHTLTLTAGTNNYVLMYDCTDNNAANNIQGLRTIMKVTSASDSVIMPVVNNTDLSTAGLQVTTSVCKIGTANVTAVSDKVSAL